MHSEGRGKGVKQRTPQANFQKSCDLNAIKPKIRDPLAILSEKNWPLRDSNTNLSYPSPSFSTVFKARNKGESENTKHQKTQIVVSGFTMKIVILLLALTAAALVSCDSSCSHESTPKLSKCSGCPPKFNGKLCASTTRYNDLTKGACGCGTEPNPPNYWTKVRSQLIFL